MLGMRRAPFATACSLVCAPTFCSAPAGRANSSLSKPSGAEACETPQLSGLDFRMLVNLDGEIGHLDFH